MTERQQITIVLDVREQWDVCITEEKTFPVSMTNAWNQAIEETNKTIMTYLWWYCLCGLANAVLLMFLNG